MPLYTYDTLPTAEKPAPLKPIPVTVCTISHADAGEPCKACGWASGSGHGKVRG